MKPVKETHYSDGRKKDTKLFETTCAGCGVTMVTKLYIDATVDEMDEANREYCSTCRLRNQAGVQTYICRYCRTDTFYIRKIPLADGKFSNEIRCSKCSYNEQVLK